MGGGRGSSLCRPLDETESSIKIRGGHDPDMPHHRTSLHVVSIIYILNPVYIICIYIHLYKHIYTYINIYKRKTKCIIRRFPTPSSVEHRAPSEGMGLDRARDAPGAWKLVNAG